MSRMIRWSLRWGDPYPSPPQREGRVRAAVAVPAGTPCPPEISKLWEAGSGWVICWDMIDQAPVRRWSQEAKARVRQRNLRKRTERKFPLFAETFIADELAKRPDYYSAEYEDVLEKL